MSIGGPHIFGEGKEKKCSEKDTECGKSFIRRSTVSAKKRSEPATTSFRKGGTSQGEGENGQLAVRGGIKGVLILKSD